LEDTLGTQPDHGTELVPRPERTPDAVRVALARIAPHRLDEMEKHKEEALAAAIRTSKIGHLQHWLTETWSPAVYTTDPAGVTNGSGSNPARGTTR